MNKIEKLMGAGLAALGTVGVSAYSLSRYMLRFALDREPPELIQKMTETAKLPLELEELSKQSREMAGKLEQAEHEQVKIHSHDGLCLVGHWFPVENAQRTIIAMHGWRSSWSEDFGMIADFWRENGCNVLYAEQRAQGNSEGKHMGFGMLERYDCRAWLEWITLNFGRNLPVYLCGISMGASTVLMASGFALPRHVKGIIADCGFTSADAIWRHVTENRFHLPYTLNSRFVEALCTKKLKVGAQSYSCPEALKESKTPVLFIHGSDDELVPVEMSYENYKACAAEKQIFIVPGAGHGLSYCVNKAGYEAVMKNFWMQNDHRE